MTDCGPAGCSCAAKTDRCVGPVAKGTDEHKAACCAPEHATKEMTCRVDEAGLIISLGSDEHKAACCALCAATKGCVLVRDCLCVLFLTAFVTKAFCPVFPLSHRGAELLCSTAFVTETTPFIALQWVISVPASSVPASTAEVSSERRCR